LQNCRNSSRNVRAAGPPGAFNEDLATSLEHTMNRLSMLALSLTIASGVALATVGIDAQARERTTTVTGAKGKTAQRHVERSRGDVSSSTTGPNGKTSSRTVDRSAEGTTATVTGPNGQTATRTTTRP
jgi:hypothetical protein